MADAIDPSSSRAKEAPPEGPPAPRTDPPVTGPRAPGQSEQPPAAGAAGAGSTHSQSSHRWRKLLLTLALATGLPGGLYALFPTIMTALNTVSTDDAYVNGHVTFVAPRVAGEVSAVLVDDNMRVNKGNILVQLDKEPYQIKRAIKQAAVTTAQADLTAAQARIRGVIGLVRAGRFALEHAIEDVNSKIADLRANVATLKSKRASLDLARANLRRGDELLPSGGISKEDVETRRRQVQVDEAAVDQALQTVYASRVGLGIPIEPQAGKDLGYVPPGLEDNFSSVRQALEQVAQNVAELGYFPPSVDATPKEAIAEFLKQDPEGNLERIYTKLIPNAPAIKQAEAKLEQAKRDLSQAELDLRYCDIVAEIDGVVTRRNVNPGNNVQAGQSLMAVRSLTEIWIDANFKETQLADLRIGHRVRCEVDMYGSRRDFEGRITGFTMGTGQTLSLLPPQNATGNFVKIVQRLPVRIELTDYDPDKVPIFIGLSVVPYVYYKEPPTGPHAGDLLQPLKPLPVGQAVSASSADSQQSPPPAKARAAPEG
jgi:membrane fusion protein (multidrug efflux system)